MTSPCSIQTRRAGFPGLGPLVTLLALVSTGCPGNGAMTTDEPGTTTGQTTGDATTTPTSTTQTPTTPTTVDLTTTGDTTTATTGEPSTTTSADTGTSTGGEPALACPDFGNEQACVANAECKWSGVVEFTYSAQGCQGGIVNFCIPKKLSGGATAWYREVGGQTQVVEFGYTPTDLDESWKACDCEGPLACLCTSVTEDCPDRQDEFCGVNITQLGCENATFKGDSVCGWFQVSPEGAPDDMCALNPKHQRCLPAVDTGLTGCNAEKGPLPPPCIGDKLDPVYWHVTDDNIIEIAKACGPKPLGWTHCEATDTPEQPDECTCLCL